MTSTPQLEYAQRRSARRHWGWRAARWWPVGVLLVTVGLGIAYGPGAWRRWRVWRLQEACLTAEMPADRPLRERDPAAAKALVAARPGEYQLNPWCSAVRVDPRWAALAGELGVPAWPGIRAGPPFATVFCHERRTPDGRRRLVVVEGFAHATVIEPADWPLSVGPRLLWADVIESDSDSATDEALGLANWPFGSYLLGAGVPDPADLARFTISYVQNGVALTWEYRLGDDDRVTMRLLDPDGFKARVAAAKAAAAATQPAP